MEGFPEYCFVETRSLCVSLICGDSLHSPWSARVPPEKRSLTRVEWMKQVCRGCAKIFVGRKSLLVHEILSLIQVSQ
ncbi:MAG: hypothetical protein RMX96_22135 [Nostoc sp. ChiSLP02]|nr:hypothetical protein [Nostoc sp. ChiSLP02]